LARDRLRSAMVGLLGIGLMDLDALEHLERYGQMTQRELAERLLITSGATTMLVDRLEAMGLLRRVPHPSDRRARCVTLEARPALPELPELEFYHQAIAAAAAALPGGTQTRVDTFLSDLVTHASNAADEMRARTPARSRRR
jgi:MarR family